MNSRTTERFWKCYAELPMAIKKLAKKAYKQFQEDPYYPSLYFKQVHSTYASQERLINCYSCTISPFSRPIACSTNVINSPAFSMESFASSGVPSEKSP